MKTDLSTIDKISYLIVVVTVMLFLAVLGCSCSGAKQNKKEDSKSDSTSVVAIKEVEKEVNSIKQVVKIDSTSTKSKTKQETSSNSKIKFASVDPKQESSITDSDGKTIKFKNLKGSIEKEQKNINTKHDETTRKLSQTEQEITQIKETMRSLDSEVQLIKKSTAKEFNKEQFNWSKFVLSFWWLWLIILLALIASYLYFKKINPLVFIKSRL